MEKKNLRKTTTRAHAHTHTKKNLALKAMRSKDNGTFVEKKNNKKLKIAPTQQTPQTSLNSQQ